jgi:uncharacterized membrane protein
MAMMFLTLVCDFVRFVTADPFWSRAGFYSIFAGAIASAMVAVPGFIDWLASPADSEERRAGTVHVALVGSAVTLALLSVVLRLAGGAETLMVLPLVLTLAGVSLLVASGWLGAAAVEKFGVWTSNGGDEWEDGPHEPHHA